MAETRKTSERFKSIEEALAAIESEIKNPEVVLRAISKIDNSVKELRKQITEIQGELQAANVKSALQEKEIGVLQADNRYLRAEMGEIRDLLENQEREKRKSWLEFTGIPDAKGEDYMNIVEKIHVACSVGFSKSDINEGYIKYGKNGKGKIIIKYVKAETKEKIQKAVKTKKLKTSDIGVANGVSSVFANDSLSYYTGNLFWSTRRARFEKKWNATWTYKGRIFVKINLEDSAINIKNQEDLIKLVK